ncbi:MAG: hypothetical protein GQ579_05380 [Bacteroidales bacterium]|nr:hypothetical protein [Bacteroidales bacterium]
MGSSVDAWVLYCSYLIKGISPDSNISTL